MPLSRLENFLINTDGNILYVNPSDLDATDSFDNKGNSLTRPFKTIQRALIEAARFAYQIGADNDTFDKTTILLYPGTHLIDNRPGLFLKNNGGTAQYLNQSEAVVGNPDIELTENSIFDLNNANNVLHKLNSVDGGVIVPKGTSLVGLDLRKTKVRPLYVPDPEDSNISRSAMFRVTGGCYFWQFSLFDADRSVFVNNDVSDKRNPSFSHHKLTCFEYADGLNKKNLTGLTDLQMYYFKLMNAYGTTTGNRDINDFPTFSDFEPNSPEFKIVGDLSANDFEIVELTSSDTTATVTTKSVTNLSKDDSFRVVGVGSAPYNGSFKVTGINSERQFQYKMLSDPIDDVITVGSGHKVVIEADNVTGASPYIFNISLRSVFGMCGMHADGSKATGFKSMVVAQFTGIGLQKDPNAFVIYNDVTGAYDTNDTTTEPKPLYINQEASYKQSYENFHVKASNDAVIQAVSVFAIGFAQHFLTEDGADQSITNSNSNFGAKSLVSVGFRKDAFARDDSGYITHIIPPKDRQEEKVNVLWKTIDVGVTTSVGISSHLYLLGEKDEGNPPSNISDGYRVGANFEEKIYLDANLAGINTTFVSSVVMDVPTGVGPTGKKEFTVGRVLDNNVEVNEINVSSNELTLTVNHNLTTGESVTLNSDNGILPGGLEHETIYYVVTTGSADKIKLANSFNNAVATSPTVVDIKSKTGGIISVISRVSDKLPGDIGHPIQFDSNTVTIDGVAVTRGWYVLSTASNGIFTGISDSTTGAIIKDNPSTTFFQRIPENRDLDDRIYKLRYVVPKEFSDAKSPTKNFILQESSTTGEDVSIGGNISNLLANRNPRVIAGITTAVASNVTTATVTTEMEHRLQVNDRVRIKGVTSSNAANSSGLNGYFTVKSVTGTRTFTFEYPAEPTAGTFTNDVTTRGTTLPTVSKNEYDTTYIIREIETVQEYQDGSQDGIYYLTCLVGNISPTLGENDPSGYNVKKFKQDYEYIYPTIDKDNPNNDPVQTISAASNKLIGKVYVDDEQRSISKESTIDYLIDNRVGFAVTTVTWTGGNATFLVNGNHNLDRIVRVSQTTDGGGYGSDGDELFNVVLNQESAPANNGFGADATANVTVGSGGTITSITIVNGGGAYGVGNTLTVAGGDGRCTVTVEEVMSSANQTFQVVGVGTLTNRNNSGYNGVWEINQSTSPKPQPNEIRVSMPVNPGVHTTANTGVIIPVDRSQSVTSIAGVAGTTIAGIVTVTHSGTGFAVGNKIKISGVVGSSGTIFNNDFIVNRIVGINTFEVKAGIGVSMTGTQTDAKVFKYGLGAFGEDTSLQNEKIGGSMIEFFDGHRHEIGTLNLTDTTINFNSGNNNLIKPGDFLQIRNEIVRCLSKPTTTTIAVLRGVLGTIATAHPIGTLMRGIKVIPSEVRRFSSIRASGHTFEYIGYGPGNYSTALPQRIKRTLTDEEEQLAIYCEKKGGVTFFSGMNDRGEFFTWDGRVKPVERFISEVGNDFTGIFDDLYVRNTLRVGGGPNKNLPSEFQGPVNFTNKVTNTDTQDGINAIKLQLRGNSLVNPLFSVGPEDNPSLIVNQSNQFVGIKTATPKFELDVNGTIRANTYENFKLTDLPNTPTEEVTFARNRVLKVNEDATGYELVDIHTLDKFRLSSYGVSGDATVHDGVGISTNTITGISTARFAVGDRVKIFGVTESTDTDTVASLGVGGVAIPTYEKVGTAGTSRLYRYWVAQYHMKNGKVGIATQITPKAGIGHTTIDDFNDQNHIVLTLNKTNDTNIGLLVYRQESAPGVSADINAAQLIDILGPKEFAGATSGIKWQDYGVYDKTSWSSKDTKNRFDDDQIHFPNIGTEGQRRGWAIDRIVSIGASSITVNNGYNYNSTVGFGTTAAVKVTHDNTSALKTAMDDIIAKGGNYLDLPSGTYYANQITIPSGFTLKGNGKNTILKRQFFAYDANDGNGNSLGFNNNFVTIGTNVNTRDMTVSDITLDGNSSNSIRFFNEIDNYLAVFTGTNSSLFRSMEIRNSPAHGLTIEDSRRVSIENCTFVDGSLTDRYPFEPLGAQESEVLRVNDSLFENYPGPVDLSVTSVVSTGGNIIRNCGTGLRTFATGKITTSNNILLGPADEFLPTPDLYDSDFNSINLTIDTQADFEGPVMQYIEDGQPKDISSTKVNIISAGIGTIVGLYSTTITETLGTRFLEFDIKTFDANSTFSREEGYIQLTMPQSKTSTLSTGLTSAFGYNIIAEEYLDVPTGFTTYIGISTGAWFKNGSAFIGAGATEYRVTLSNPDDYVGIATGDIVKLNDHQVSPSLGAKALTVQQKEEVSAVNKQLRLVGITTNSVVNGAPPVGATVNGYISIRKQFVIAKGRVGVI